MKDILIIGYMHPKYDKRTYRTVSTLSQEYKIYYQYWTNDEKEIEYEENNIVYIPVYYKKNIQAHPFIKLKNRKNIDLKIIEIMKRKKYDTIYFHHFLARFPVKSFKIAKKQCNQIVYDLHEYHPENFLSAMKGIKRKMKISIMTKIFKKQLNIVDKVIYVSQGIKDYMDNNNYDLKHPYIIVPNYAISSLKVKKIEERDKRIAFLGKVPRDLDEEKEILKRLNNLGYEIALIGIDEIKDKALSFIKPMGFLPYEKMLEETSKCMFTFLSFGIVQPVNHIYCMPNKYFDSIGAGVPIILADKFITMQNMTKKYKNGIIININNPDESIEKIKKLSTKENYNELLKNIEKYQNEFIWNQKQKQKLIDFIKK
ncbi:hypothetical protein OSSY52_03110 [Tepiditoga spiralis]|uniref:Glycosyl transferase n=1 Tax=Tepiditoga spiralis TaxID=2108365 RepID=A0A7G1G1R4_9BACT|nr:glycosyl transferase family 1 [Tepiditoga spiralis]BBE30170.1 hypothetical protein OSSY52_03110 [Tepiditoga spiralis]